MNFFGITGDSLYENGAESQVEDDVEKSANRKGKSVDAKLLGAVYSGEEYGENERERSRYKFRGKEV